MNTFAPAADIMLECPTNLSLPPGVTVRYVDRDLYDICERIKEISPDLRVIMYDGQEDKYLWGIVEETPTGTKLVFKVGPAATETPELDGRVLAKLRRILALPLSERLVALEKEEAEFAAAYRDNQLEELYERVGGPMWSQLEHDGFIQRPVSYPKRGVKPT